MVENLLKNPLLLSMTIGSLIILTIFLIIFIKHLKNEEEDTKSIEEEKGLGKFAMQTAGGRPVKSDDLIIGENQAGGGIISKKVIRPEGVQQKDKIAKWVDTASYEEDLKEKVSAAPVVHTNASPEQADIKHLILKPIVLLVDDSLVVRKYVGDLLRQQDYEVITKNDGWEAITYLNTNTQKPDLIITDIQMPNMDGFQLIEAIRKEKRFNTMPIMVISAHVDEADHLALIESETIEAFLRKPFEDNDLIQQTHYLLN